MFIADSSFLLKYKLYRFKLKKRRNFYKRRRGKHLDNLFICRKKRYELYYQTFDSKKIKKNVGCGKNTLLENNKKYKYRIGFKSIEFDLIRSNSIKSLKYCTQRFLRSRKINKKYYRNSVSVFPSYWLTAKPKSVRMGKGKGKLTLKVAFLNKGKDIYSIRFLRWYLNFNIKKKMYVLKFCLFAFFLINILKTKTCAKNVIYKKIY